MTERRRRPPRAWLLLPLALPIAAAGVWLGFDPDARAGDELTLGEAVEVERACGVGEALACFAEATEREREQLVVAGEVSEVCASSGCWLVLRERTDDGAAELFVDLSRGADFTVPRSIVGERVCVGGRLARDGGNLVLHGRGVVRP